MRSQLIKSQLLIILKKMNDIKKIMLLLLCLIIFNIVYAEEQSKIITANDAAESIKISINAINYMKNLGLGVERVNDLLEDAKISEKKGDYGRVVDISNQIIEFKETAISLTDKINELKSLNENAKSIGINTSSVEKLLEEGIVEFEINNYELAQENIDESLRRINEILRDELMSLNNVLNDLIDKLNFEEIEISIIYDLSEQLNSRIVNKEFYDISVIKNEVNGLNKSIHNLIQIKYIIQEMLDNEFTITRIDDLYKESKLTIELGSYDRAEEIYRDVLDTENKAFEVSNSFISTQRLLEELDGQDLEVSHLYEKFHEAYNKFTINDYEEAESIVEEINTEGEALKASNLIFGVITKSELKFNLISFIQKYWLIMVIILVFLIIFVLFFYTKVYDAILMNRIRKLRKEREAIINMIKKYQEDYFKKKILSKESYNTAVDEYQERELKIKELIPILESKLSKKVIEKE